MQPVRKRNQEQGLSLLEYAAGAAVIITIIYAAMTVFGTSLDNFYGDLGNWAERKGNDINNTQ